MDEGVRLAQQRSTLLYQWIQTQPEAALQAAIPFAQRRLLPAAITAHLEERIHARGELAVVAATPRPGRAHQVTRPIFREARVNGKAYNAFVYGRRAKQDTKYGTSLMGIAIGDRMAVLDEPVQVITTAGMPDGSTLAKGMGIGGHAAPVKAEPETPVLAAQGSYYPVCCASHASSLAAQVTTAESQPGAFVEALGGGPLQGPPAFSGNSDTEGPKSVLVIVATFADALGTPLDVGPQPDVPMTSTYLSNRLTNEVSDFLQQASYGKTSIGAVTVTAELLMPNTLQSYAAANNHSGLKSDAINAATLAGHDTNAFDRVAVVFADTDNLTGNQFTWSGLGDLGGNFTWFNGHFSMHVVCHELGHNFGLRHANLWDIPAISSNPVDPLGASAEYGDPFDFMGSGPDNTNAFPNPYFSNRLSWLPDAAVQTITSDGTYRVHRYDHKDADLNSTLALRLGRNLGTDYWIGYRRKYQSGALSDVSQGAYLLWSFDSETRSHLIDVDTPGTDTTDASLNVGQTFNDAAAGVSFTVTAAGGSGVTEFLDVQVSFQPRLTFDKPTYSVDEEVPSLTLTVERRNNSAGAVSAHFATANGTALAGSDYTATSGDLSWASGDATPRTIVVPILSNAALEGAETFTVQLSAVTGAVTPSGSSVTVTIQESGATDSTFTPAFLGSAANNLVVLPDGKLVVVGNFGLTINTVVSGGVAQLDQNGVRDTSFDQGLGGTPLPLTSVARQHDGKILVGGHFTSLRSTARNRIARLNVDGSLDLSFNPGTGPNDNIHSIVVQPDGKILVGGKFSTWNGIARRALIRLNDDGTLDTTLANMDTAVDAAFGFFEVNAIALQPIDSAPHYRIIVGGFFQRASGGLAHSGLVALSATTGLRDPAFDVSSGAHVAGSPTTLTSVASLAVQPDRKVLVGGQFTGFNGTNCGHFVRLSSSGANDAPFVSNSGLGLAPAGNEFSEVSGILVQGDGKIAVAGHFSRASGNSQNGLARYQANGMFDTVFRPSITLSESLRGGKTVTMQPDGRMVVGLNGAGTGNELRRFFTSLSQAPSILQFTSTSAAGAEGLSTNLTVTRTGGSLGAVSVNYATVPRNATADSDYTPTTGTLTWADGDSTSRIISVAVTGDALVEPDESFDVRLGNPLGGSLLGDAQAATVTIAAGDLSNIPVVSFATGSSNVSEGSGVITVTLSANPVPTSSFTVPFTTGGTAIKGTGKDYTISSSPVTFAAGQATRTIEITLLQNTVLSAGKTINLTLGNPAGQSLLGTVALHTVNIADDEAAPVLTLVPPARIVTLGTSTTFSADATGTPTPTYLWKKGTSTISGQTGKNYTIPNVQLSHAGTYSVTAKNIALSPPSAGFALGVVDKSSKTLNLYEGVKSKATLTAACSTNMTGFAWKRNGGPVSNMAGHIAGAGTKTLVITGLTTANAGEYNCEVTCPGVTLPETTGPITLNVINGPPVITPKPVILPKAVVGGTYDHDVPYDLSTNLTPISFTAAPLPTGLKIDAKGHIGGRVTLALTAPKTFAVNFKATNAKSSDTATGNLVVDPLPAGSVGSFTGLIERKPLMPGNEGLGGRLTDLTVSPSGSITGTLIHGVTTHKFTGLLHAVPDNTQPTASILIPRKGTSSLTLVFTIDSPNQRFTQATLSDGTHSAEVTAWRKVTPASTFTGLYNLGLHLAVPDAALPQGIGHASFTVAATGKLTVAGKLAHGVGFTTATGIGPLGEVLVHQSSATTDTVLGVLTITPGAALDFSDTLVDGTLGWSRKQQTKGRLYLDTFGPVDLDAKGGRYVPSAVMMGLPYTAGVTLSNATLAFTDADFGGPPAVSPDVTVLIKTANGVSVLAPNTRGTTLKVVASTGAFSGVFSLTDPNPLATSTNVLRSKVPYQGLVYRDNGVLVARGWYLLNNLPRVAGETSANTKTVSGKVVLSPAP